MLTWQNSAPDFKVDGPEIAIFPLACLEPHGPHLPIGTDIRILSEIAIRVAERLPVPVFLLPTWPLGMSGCHAGQPGAVYLHYETLWAVVRDVVTSLSLLGIRNVAVLNNHGSALSSTARPLGNFVVKTAVRQLNYEIPDLTTIWVQPFAAACVELNDLFLSASEEVHAGAVETSIMMHLAAEDVGRLPPDNIPDISPAYIDFIPFHKLTPGGVWGCPNQASVEKGKQALDAAVKATVRYVLDTFERLTILKDSGIVG
jgi:creatinine amidohydrolase